jgi:hypothetical protein
MHSAEFDEAHGDCDDKIKLYNDSGCGGLPQAEANNPHCVSAAATSIHGAKIFIVIKPGKRGLSGMGGIVEPGDQPRGTVKPDESFYQNGTVRHVIKLDSPEGLAFGKLDRVEKRIDHLVRYGRIEEVPKLVKRGKCRKPIM